MVKFCGVPTHVPNFGVTTIVAVTGAVPLFSAVNAAMSPVPAAPSPMLAALFVHSNVAPAVPAKLIAAVNAPLHTAWFEGAVTVGVGLTVIVNDVVDPLHEPNEGVTTIVAVTGAAPVLIAANAAMLPVPVGASPIDGVSFVHEYDDADPVKFTRVVFAPLQTD